MRQKRRHRDRFSKRLCVPYAHESPATKQEPRFQWCSGVRAKLWVVNVFLETDRMILRRFTLDDVDAVLALDTDPEVRKFVEDGEPVNRQTATSTIEHWLGYYERSESFGFWAAIDKGSEEFLGWFHFRAPEGTPSNEPELGYRLISSAWGNGYATEGSRALIDNGFKSEGGTCRR